MIVNDEIILLLTNNPQYIYFTAEMTVLIFLSIRPFMFRTQSKEIHESGAYQTMGMDTIVTAERVILIDTQVQLLRW